MNAALPDISAPEHLTSSHSVEAFDSGESSLDRWLRERALHNETAGAWRTYVVRADGRVVGYYALATGALLREHAPSSVSRNMPEPIPVVILGRLAVDRQFQGAGIGAGLLKSAALQTIAIADTAGVRALVLHALSESAKAFYARYGFVPSPTKPMTMIARVPDLRQTFRSLP